MNDETKTEAGWCDSNYYTERIDDGWDRDLQSILQTAQLLLHAKKNQPKSINQKILRTIQISKVTLRRLLRVAKAESINDSQHHDKLPAALGHLDELSRLSSESFREFVLNGKIHRYMTRKEIADLFPNKANGAFSSQKIGFPNTSALFTVRIDKGVEDLDVIDTIRRMLEMFVKVLQSERGINFVHLEDHQLDLKLIRKMERQQQSEHNKARIKSQKLARKLIGAIIHSKRKPIPNCNGKIRFVNQSFGEEYTAIAKTGGTDLDEKLDWCLENMGVDSTIRTQTLFSDALCGSGQLSEHVEQLIEGLRK